MAAYVVFVREKTLDAEEMKLFGSKITKTLEGHPLTVLAAYGSLEVLEGPAAEGVVIAEFPSIEAARDCYGSTEYQQVAKQLIPDDETNTMLWGKWIEKIADNLVDLHP